VSTDFKKSSYPECVFSVSQSTSPFSLAMYPSKLDAIKRMIFLMKILGI